MMGFAILSMGTLAYFSDEATAHNVIASGSVEIALQEWGDVDKTIPFNDEKNKENREGLMPGESVTKIVEVKNIGNGDAWVRMKVEKAIVLANGGFNSANAAEQLVILQNMGDQWELEDGYYYYKEPLAVGATTQPLFDGVKLGETMDNRYQNCEISVNITAEAVQYANNEDRAIWE